MHRETILLSSLDDSVLDMLANGHEHEAETITHLLLEGSAHRLGHGPEAVQPDEDEGEVFEVRVKDAANACTIRLVPDPRPDRVLSARELSEFLLDRLASYRSA